MKIPFDYKCSKCGHISVIDQRRKDDMRHRKCKQRGCGGLLSRYITKAPLLDADYHDSRKYHNIGWDQ